MQIESLTVKNFRAFKDVTIKDIPRFCVFIGANGSGKTTLFDVFGFLRDCLVHNVRNALQRRGGFSEVISRGREQESIEFEIKFRMEIGGVDRLVTYVLNIITVKSKPIVKREILRYKRGRHGSPFHFLDFRKGKGYAIVNEDDFNKEDEELEREEQELDAQDILAIKGLGQFQRFKAASAFRQLIEKWHVSDFHISEARGSKDSGHAEHLSVSGDNLPLVANYIFENHRKSFDRIIERMKSRVPGIENVKAIPMENGELILKFQDDSFDRPFIDKYVSDGTIKMFAYLILLYDPQPHPLLCVEEPENQLYPSLLLELAEDFEVYARNGGQVFVSTHSPDFLNAVDIDNIFWLEKTSGFTSVHRANQNPLLVRLVDEGDQPGWLWKEKRFKGADPN